MQEFGKFPIEQELFDLDVYFHVDFFHKDIPSGLHLLLLLIQASATKRGRPCGRTVNHQFPRLLDDLV